MDFATFTQQAMAYLWRTGDTDLEAAMPQIVRTAENRMRVDLKLHDDDLTFTDALSSNPYELPTDVGVVRSVQWPGYGPGRYLTPRDFVRYQTPTPLWPGAIPNSSNAVLTDYTVEGNRLSHRFSVSPETPGAITLVYTPRPASLIDNDDRLYNEYTALYEAAVYYEALMWLVEEARAARFNTMYGAYLDGALTEQSRRMYAGSPLRMSMPRSDVS